MPAWMTLIWYVVSALRGLRDCPQLYNRLPWYMQMAVCLSVSTLIVGSVTGAVLLWLERRRRARLEARVQPVRLQDLPMGFYACGGRLLFRPSPWSNPLSVKYTGFTAPANADLSKDGKAAVLQAVFEEEPISSESAVPGAAPPSLPLKVPKYLVRISYPKSDGSHAPLGVGFRVKDWLITARHVVEDAFRATGEYAFLVGNERDAILVPSSYHSYSETYRPGYGSDLAAVPIEKDVWSRLGVGTFDPTKIRGFADGMVDVYGLPGKDILMSSGILVSDPVLESRAGVIPHLCFTTPGFSGSPLVRQHGNQTFIAGVHLAGSPKENYAATASALRKLFYKIGALELPKGGIYARLVGESTEARRQQMEWDGTDDFDITTMPDFRSRHLRANQPLTELDQATKDQIDAWTSGDVEMKLESAIPKQPPRPYACPFTGDGEKNWIDRVPETPIQPNPERELTKEEKQALMDWFENYDYNALLKIKDVGAKSLLKTNGFYRFSHYIDAGNKNVITNGAKTLNANGEVHMTHVANCTRCGPNSNGSRRTSPEAVAAAKKFGENIEGWASPPSNGEAVVRSLRVQVAKQKPGNFSKLKAQPNFKKNMKEFFGSYPTAPAPTSVDIPTHVARFIDEMDPLKSAGWCARYLPGSKSVWKNKENREILMYFVQCRFALRFAEFSTINQLTPMQMIELGLRDPEDAFAKSDAHHPDKVSDDRWRVIWSCGIIDALVQDIAHHFQNKEDIKAYHEGRMTCQAVGIGHHDAGLEKIGEIIDDFRGLDGQTPIMDSDASGWDMSVSRDAIFFDGYRRLDRIEQPSEVDVCILLLEAATNSAHVAVAGTAMLQLDVFGVTSSGIPSTTGQNSPIRAGTLRACGAEKVCAVGDDEFHTGEVDMELLASTGCITKGKVHVSLPGDPVLMTSHSYIKKNGKWTATFENFTKMLASLDLRRVPGQPPSADAIGGCRFVLRNTPGLDEHLQSFCKDLGWAVAEPMNVPWE